MKYQAKSIKTVLTAHRDEIYKFCDRPSQFKQLHQKVLDILKSDELKGNQSVLEAIDILNRCSHNYTKYITTLTTYMTGIKVSLY